MSTVFVGDVGTKLEVNIGIPADDVTTAKLIVKKPNGDVVEWEATPVSGSENIEYIVKEGDLDVEGTYRIQAYVETANWKGYGTIAYLGVEDHL